MQVVAPKRATLAEANRKLSDANKKLASIRARVRELYDRVANLENSLMKVRLCGSETFLLCITSWHIPHLGVATKRTSGFVGLRSAHDGFLICGATRHLVEKQCQSVDNCPYRI